MDLSAGGFFALAVSSGAAAGVANQAARLLHDWLAAKRQTESQARELDHQKKLQDRELEHQRSMQREEREHQAQLRREEAFFEAKEDLLGYAVSVYDWVQWWWGDLYGAEVDYYPVSLNKPQVQTAADAITALQEIAGKHPFKEIRVFARTLADTIDGVVNMPDPGGDSDPGLSDLDYWSRCANELIDALHDPTHKPTLPSRDGQ